MIITHNMSATNAYMQYNRVSGAQSKTMNKLSSGYKVNSASDDAAGLSISEKMRGQIRGLQKASYDCQDGVSMLQVADGAMSEIHDMLHRCEELCIKAATDILTPGDRACIQAEIDQLRDEIDEITEQTEFNMIRVLKGGEMRVLVPGEPRYPTNIPIGDVDLVEKELDFLTCPSFSVGHFSQLVDRYTGEVLAVDATGRNVSYGAVIDLNGFTASDDQIKQIVGGGIYTTCCTCSRYYSIRFVDKAPMWSEVKSGDHYIYNVNVKGVQSAEDLIGRIKKVVKKTPQNHYTDFIYDEAGKTISIVDNRGKTYLDGIGAIPNDKFGRIGSGWATSKGVDPDKPPYIPYVSEIGENPEGTLIIQAGANVKQEMVLKMPDLSCESLAINEVVVDPYDEADAGISVFQHASELISQEKSRMGAYQNRLEHIVKNVDNTAENLQISESRIRDTDMAEAMMDSAKNTILLETGQAMIANSMKSTQGVLNLLR